MTRDGTAHLAVYEQRTRREAGQRQITLPRGGCREAADVLALVIAVMVEAGRPLASEQPPEDPEPPPEPPKEPEPEADHARPEPPADEGPPQYKRPERYAWQGPPAGHDLSLGVGLALGLLPNNSGLGANLGWGIRGSRVWPIWIEASGWLPQESRNRKALIGTAYGLLSTCPLYLSWPQVRIRLCPGIALGAVWADGRRLPRTTNSVRLLTMAALTAGVHVRIFGPLELVLAARMEVPFARPKFVYRRADNRYPVIHESAVIAGSFFGGLGLCFR